MATIRRTAIFVHRWLGIALSFLFVLWFSSGFVMMYRSFPSISEQDRLDRLPALDAASIHISPSEAFTKLDQAKSPTQIRLNMYDGRPVYRFRTGRAERLVYADTGDEQTRVSAEMIDRAAAAWTGQAVRQATRESVLEVDQWTVQGPLRNLRPLWKYSWPNGEQVYVSGLTAEIVQYTTASSRFWAWLGAIPHWLYFTPLRKHQVPWEAVVVWTSALGTFAAVLGLILAVWAYSPSKSYRYGNRPTRIPYHGWKRWHTILGLIFGFTAATWVFSGFLSMDPFPAKSGRGRPDRVDIRVDIPTALRGKVRLAAFDSKQPGVALTQVQGRRVKELELASFAGEPVYLARIGPGDTCIVPVTGAPIEEFSRDRIIEIARQAAGSAGVAEVQVMGDYDAYYLDRRHERPLPVVMVRLNDAERTRYYIDPKTALVVGNYGSSKWAERWLYHGLHSWDFPWLYNHRPLWDVVVIAFMSGGSLLCFTSLLLAWRAVGRFVAKIY
jgi:PepSY-associated TM region